MSKAAHDEGDVEHRVVEVKRQIVQALKRLEDEIQAGADRQDLLDSLFLLRGLLQSHWLLLGVTDSPTDTP